MFNAVHSPNYIPYKNQLANNSSASLGAALIGYYNGQTNGANRTLASKLNDIVFLSDFDTLANAISDIGSDPTTLIIQSEVTESANITIPNTIHLEFFGAGKLSPPTGYTYTINAPIPEIRKQIFDGDGTITFGSTWAGFLIPVEWFGAVGDNSTDCTTAVQAAIDANTGNRRGVVSLGAGTYKLTSTISSNNLGQSIMGIDRLSSLFYFDVDSDIALELTSEHCTLMNLGFVTTAGNGNDTTAINLNGAPTCTLFNIYIDGYNKAITGNDSWNCTFDAVYASGCRTYGVRWTSNGNATNFKNCIMDGASGGTEIGYDFDTCHAISIIGGAIEDFKHAIQTNGVELSVDTYFENQDEEDIYMKSANDLVTVKNAYCYDSSTSSDKAFAKADGGKLIVEQARFSGGVGGYTSVFDMSGGSQAYYGNVAKISGQIVGTCVTSSGGMIHPLFPIRKTTLRANVDCSITATSRVFTLGFVARPWKIARIATKPTYGTPSSVSANFDLGTDSDDDIIVAAHTVSNTSDILVVSSEYTQVGIPYTNQAGYLILTANQTGTAACGYDVIVEIYDGYSGSTVDGTRDDMIADRVPLPADLLL